MSAPQVTRKLCPEHPKAATEVSVHYLDGDVTRRCVTCHRYARPVPVLQEPENGDGEVYRAAA